MSFVQKYYCIHFKYKYKINLSALNPAVGPNSDILEGRCRSRWNYGLSKREGFGSSPISQSPSKLLPSLLRDPGSLDGNMHT